MKQDRSAMEPSPGEQSATAAMPTWDYVSRGLRDPRLKRLFPQMVAGDRSQNAWPYLRSEIPHSWYVDARFPTMGFLSLDEATLLHALALPFAGKPALEIGCWRGWSTAHLLSAGVVLDVVDPILADEGPREEIRAIARGLGAADRAALHGARSPEGIVEAAERRGEPWSFIFIDGDHEAPGPFLDAVAVAPCAADDAMIVFHDLASPHVAAGLDALRDLGWATRVFQTMQIMGVAWRGTAAPVTHHPDGRVSWTIPEHLQAYAFSGEDERTRDERFRRVLERHSALLRELVFANEIAAAIPSRTGDFAMAAVWKKATAGPPGAPQPPLGRRQEALRGAGNRPQGGVRRDRTSRRGPSQDSPGSRRRTRRRARLVRRAGGGTGRDRSRRQGARRRLGDCPRPGGRADGVARTRRRARHRSRIDAGGTRTGRGGIGAPATAGDGA